MKTPFSALNRIAGQSAADLLTKKEACEILRIRPRTLDDWRADQSIPCIQRGRYVRFLRRDLEAFLASHRVEAKPRPAFRRRAVSAAVVIPQC